MATRPITDADAAGTSAYISLGNGNDTISLGAGNDTVSLGYGNDSVAAGNGNDNVTVGNGNDNVQLGNGSDVIVEGNGNDNVSAGNGPDLVVGGLGQHTIQLGNGNDILIDGSATVVKSGDSLRQILSDWNCKLVGLGRHASEGGVQHVSPQRLEGGQRSRLVLLHLLQRRDQQEVDRSPQLTPRSTSVATSLSCRGPARPTGRLVPLAYSPRAFPLADAPPVGRSSFQLQRNRSICPHVSGYFIRRRLKGDSSFPSLKKNQILKP